MCRRSWEPYIALTRSKYPVIRCVDSCIRSFAPSKGLRKALARLHAPLSRTTARIVSGMLRAAMEFCLPPGTAWMKELSQRSEEHTSELQSHLNLVCRLLLEKKKKKNTQRATDDNYE